MPRCRQARLMGVLEKRIIDELKSEGVRSLIYDFGTEGSFMNCTGGSARSGDISVALFHSERGKQQSQIKHLTPCVYSSFELSSSDMQEIARIAPTDVAFGMSRVFEAYANETGFDIMVFRDSEDAKAWIL